MAKGKVKGKSKRGPASALPPPSGLKPSHAMVWRLALGATLLLCLALGGVLWLSGKSETKQAFANGQRLLIRIDNGVIEGKQFTADVPKPPPAPVAHTEHADTPDKAEEAAVKLPATPVTPLPPLNPALAEKAADGAALPVIGANGTAPWRYYGKPYERKGTLPMIAIVVSGLGENKTVTESALSMPENITLSFSPYARDIDMWAKTARANGHEVLIDLPLEPANYPVSDPGPYGLLTGKASDKNQAHLQWLMSRCQGYAGFLTPQNEGFSDDTEAFKSLMQWLANRGLLLVVGRAPAKSDTQQLLDADNALDVVADVLLDEDLSASAIQTRLNTLERTAKTRGYAIGIGQAYPLTIQQLNLWADKLAEDGFVLVPVTYIARLRLS